MKDFIEGGKEVVKMMMVITLVKATVIGLSVMAKEILKSA